MFTRNIKDTFTANLLNAVSGVLGEAKKCKDCGCAECTCDDAEDQPEETKENYVSHAQRKAVWANRADDGKGHPDKKKMKKEGYMPTNDMPSDKDRKTAGKLGDLLKRERESKEKKEPNGVKTEDTDMPWAEDPNNPTRKAGVRKDEYGNKVKNIAKHLAKKAMKANEEVEEIEEKRGLWDNIHAKRKRIKAGSGERMRKPGSEGAPTAQDFKDSQKESVELDEDHQYVEITNAHHGGKSYIPVHKTQAFAALNHYRSFSHNKGVRIIDKKQHDAIQAAKTPWNPSGESHSPFKEELEEAWVVKKGTEVVSSHKSKDEADVKAMKNPMYKVCAKEEHDFNKAFEQIDEISAKTAVNAYAKRNAKAFNDGQYDDEAEKDYNKLDKQGDRIQKKFGAKIVQKAQKAASKKIFGEEHEEDAGWYTHSQMHGSKKSEKHPKGISAAEWKSGIRWHHGKNKRINIKEEIEELDELSKGTMGRYINKAKDSIDIVSYRQGHKEAHGSSAPGAEKKLTKRHKGISTAVSKLTKEEQDFVDALNDEIFEKADPYDIAGMIKKAKAKNDPNHPAMKHVAAIEDMKKHGGALSVQGDHVRSLIKALGEDAEITEARGRPRKAGAKDFTIHPKTKEKLMHNNPADMARIERLQKNGILQKPKTEANQHVMQQLQRAKLSMRGGETVNFTHGDPHHVTGDHAAKLLTKYAGMKPDEKEAFQKKIGHSHANLKSEL
jgi:hypothetical protein